MTQNCMNDCRLHVFLINSRREKADLGVKVSIVIPGAFYTSDNDIEVVWKQLKNKWMRTPEEIKQHYDINYLEKGRLYRFNLIIIEKLE